MSKKLMLLALAAVSAVMFALPAVASAGVWEISTPESFTATTTEPTTLTQDPLNAEDKPSEVTCTSSTTTGKYTTKTTGEELTITFTGCKDVNSGVSCTSSGQASGTIKTTDLTFHNVMLEKTLALEYPTGTPGILITPKEGHFATFTCGLVFKVEVKGNGIIGDVEEPCGKTTKTTGLDFTSKATGTQRWTQITTEGTVYDLSSTQTFFGGGATTRTASEDGTGTVTFKNNQTITCP